MPLVVPVGFAAEAILFSEALQQYRDLLEPGSPVLLGLTAEAQGDEIRARIQTAEPLDRAASRLPTALRITIDDEKALASLSGALNERGDGEVSIILQLEGGAREVEVKVPGGFRATPQVAGILRTLPGVLAVEHA